MVVDLLINLIGFFCKFCQFILIVVMMNVIDSLKLIDLCIEVYFYECLDDVSYNKIKCMILFLNC